MALAPAPPSPSIPKEILEEITGHQVLTYLIEDGSKPGDGFMSILYSVSAELIIPTKVKDSVTERHHFLFKCFPRHPARQSYLCKTNMFYNELSFYRVWAKALRDFQLDTIGLSEDELIIPSFPKFIGGRAVDFTEWDESDVTVHKPLDNFIVMTDLRKAEGLQMVDKADGLDLDHLTLVFNELAKIHALSWAYKNKVEWKLSKKYPFLQTRIDEKDKTLWRNIVQSNVDIAVQAMNGALGDDNALSKSTKDFAVNLKQIVDLLLEQGEEAEKETWKMHRDPSKEMIEASKDEKPWRIQSHGDAWSNNMLFKYNDVTGKPERVTLIDFQLTREACPTLDLIVLMYSSTSSQFRKKNLDSLLQLYCVRFLEVCKHLQVAPLPGFGFDSLKRRFHRGMIMGYMMALVFAPNIFSEKGQVTDMEQVGEDANIEEMFIESFKQGSQGSSMYKKKVLEVAQDMYDQGVI